MQNKSPFLATFISLGIIGCDSPEVNDKIASILTNGLIAGEVKCSGQWYVGTTDGAGANPPTPDSGSPVYHDFYYRAQKFQDGTCFMAWSEVGPEPTMFEFIPRHSAKYVDCEVGTEGIMAAESEELIITSSAYSARYVQGPRNNHSSWEYYLPNPAPTTVFDMETQCTGFNFALFGAE